MKRYHGLSVLTFLTTTLIMMTTTLLVIVITMMTRWQWRRQCDDDIDIDDDDNVEVTVNFLSFFRYRIKTWGYSSGRLYSSCKNFTHRRGLQIQPGVWGKNTTISLLVPGVYHIPKKISNVFIGYFVFSVRFYVIHNDFILFIVTEKCSREVSLVDTQRSTRKPSEKQIWEYSCM